MAFNLRTINNVTPTVAIERESRREEGMTDVSKTLFLPLFFRAQETREGGIINDKEAVRIIDSLHYENGNFLLDREMQLVIALRTVVLDDIVRRYIAEMHDERRQPVIVNLGAGLDTREQRFPEATWYQVDLESPIRLRRQYLPESPATTIAASIFEDGWSDGIRHHDHVLFIVEGVLMYFDEEMDHNFFRLLSRNFRESYVAFDALAKRYTSLHAHQSIDVDKASFLCGVTNGNDVERWNLGFKTIEEYGYYQTYLDHYEQIKYRYRLIRFDATHKIYFLKRQ